MQTRTKRSQSTSIFYAMFMLPTLCTVCTKSCTLMCVRLTACILHSLALLGGREPAGEVHANNIDYFVPHLASQDTYCCLALEE